MEVATLFSILVLETTMTIDRLEDAVSTILLRWLQWFNLLSSELWLTLWKEKQTWKESTNLFSGWNSLLRELKVGKIKRNDVEVIKTQIFSPIVLLLHDYKKE